MGAQAASGAGPSRQSTNQSTNRLKRLKPGPAADNAATAGGRGGRWWPASRAEKPPHSEPGERGGAEAPWNVRRASGSDGPHGAARPKAAGESLRHAVLPPPADRSGPAARRAALGGGSEGGSGCRAGGGGLIRPSRHARPAGGERRHSSGANGGRTNLRPAGRTRTTKPSQEERPSAEACPEQQADRSQGDRWWGGWARPAASGPAAGQRGRKGRPEPMRAPTSPLSPVRGIF